MTINSFRDLEVWRKGMDLATETYRLAKLMPKTEEFRITSQILRAAASVPANIAEGHTRGSRREYAQFVSIARGSLAETETFLLLAIRTNSCWKRRWRTHSRSRACSASNSMCCDSA
jgi:four helix bundle protein